ncbi:MULTISPECIES: hypothetical protein [unclassified Acetomicrobium]|nr:MULTISPECIES: hypothetical protein [Acetomicrobium]
MEILKIYEHKLKDAKAALSWADKAMRISYNIVPLLWHGKIDCLIFQSA